MNGWPPPWLSKQLRPTPPFSEVTSQIVMLGEAAHEAASLSWAAVSIGERRR